MSNTKMKSSAHLRCGLALAGVLLVPVLSAWSASLSPGEPVLLEKTGGKFDFIRVDIAKNRLLLAHTGNKSLDVFDLESKRLLKSVATGAAQDCAIDAKNDRYYASVSDPPRMAIVDATSLEMAGEIALPAAADLIAFNTANGRAYVCNDVSPELWIIDPAARKILTTITLSGKGMEDLSFDPGNYRLYQVVMDANAVVLIDPSNNKVLETWSSAPATNPHGMALIPQSDHFLVAGGSGKLVLMDRSNGRVLSSAEIAPRVDQMAYDPPSHTAYCASGQGKISIVAVDGAKLTALGEVTSAPGCHSIAVDPKTHTVWIAFSKGDESFVQPFTASSGSRR
jgi:hypothetical protein